MLKKIFSSKKEKRDISIDKQLDLNKLPQHVGIIMDGNGRWATGKGLIRTSGHKAGVKTLKKILKTCIKYNIPILTVYAFSTENWKRPMTEVNFLMNLFSSFLAEQIDEMCEDNVRIHFIGRVDELPGNLPNELHAAEERTKNNTGVRFNVAVNYGGRDEIIHAVKNIIERVQNKEIDIEDITEQTISDNLYTANQPDPDLLIRTSGEIRLSNFLPWQLVYTEFLFVDKNWPDFNEKDLDDAIEVYRSRNRKFGAK